MRCFKGYRFKSAWSKRNGIAKVVGSGDVYITASEQLSATIVGSGDIHINGDVGKIEKKIVGSGSINKR